MESNTSILLRELVAFLLLFGAFASPFLMVDILRSHNLVLRIRANEPQWRFNYSFAEYCTFLIPLAFVCLVIGIQIQDSMAFERVPSYVLEDMGMFLALVLVAVVLALAGMVRGKLKHRLSGKQGNAVLFMLGGGIFSTLAGSLLVVFFAAMVKLYG